MDVYSLIDFTSVTYSIANDSWHVGVWLCIYHVNTTLNSLDVENVCACSHQSLSTPQCLRDGGQASRCLTPCLTLRFQGLGAAEVCLSEHTHPRPPPRTHPTRLDSRENTGRGKRAARCDTLESNSLPFQAVTSQLSLLHFLFVAEDVCCKR